MVFQRMFHFVCVHTHTTQYRSAYIKGKFELSVQLKKGYKMVLCVAYTAGPPSTTTMYNELVRSLCDFDEAWLYTKRNILHPIFYFSLTKSYEFIIASRVQLIEIPKREMKMFLSSIVYNKLWSFKIHWWYIGGGGSEVIELILSENY